MLTGVTVLADAPDYFEGETVGYRFTLDQPAPQGYYLDLLLSGGPAGPTGYVLPIAEGETTIHVDLPTTDNIAPGDSYTLSLTITGSSEKKGPKGPFDTASTKIIDDDGIAENNFLTSTESTGSSGPSGPSGPTGPTGATAPTVTVEATQATAHEVGPQTGTFTFVRSGADTTQALTIQFTVSGSATMGSDYVSFPSSITIPANLPSATVIVTPFTDTDIEGIETVVVTITASATYTFGEYIEATVNIRDRAGVKNIVATAGIAGISGEPGRDVTFAELRLVQNDSMSLLAIPTDGGDSAADEPTWTVTSEATSTGATRTVNFGMFRKETRITASTPANATPKFVDVELVPYPSGIQNTRAVAYVPPPPAPLIPD